MVAQSVTLADRLNCSTTASRTQLGPEGTPDRALVVQCLRRVDVERLVEAAGRGTGGRPVDVWSAPRFGPTLGGIGAVVLPASSVEQLVNDACDNRLTLVAFFISNRRPVTFDRVASF